MLWEFGDGSTDTASNPVHLYSRYGTYRVILKTWDAEEVMDSVAKELILFESITDEFNGKSDPRAASVGAI
jgi:PKD repeat protein